MTSRTRPRRDFSLSAGLLLGPGIGGFRDGRVLHQVPQWHHAVTSAGYPPTSPETPRFGVFRDGFSYLATDVLVVLGLVMSWRADRGGDLKWDRGLVVGALLIRFGLSNAAEGRGAHRLLGLHNVNEPAAPSHWIHRNVGFPIWDAAMPGGGWFLRRRPPCVTVAADG